MTIHIDEVSQRREQQTAIMINESLSFYHINHPFKGSVLLTALESVNYLGELYRRVTGERE